MSWTKVLDTKSLQSMPPLKIKELAKLHPNLSHLIYHDRHQQKKFDVYNPEKKFFEIKWLADQPGYEEEPQESLAHLINEFLKLIKQSEKFKNEYPTLQTIVDFYRVIAVKKNPNAEQFNPFLQTNSQDYKIALRAMHYLLRHGGESGLIALIHSFKMTQIAYDQDEKFFFPPPYHRYACPHGFLVQIRSAISEYKALVDDCSAFDLQSYLNKEFFLLVRNFIFDESDSQYQRLNQQLEVLVMRFMYPYMLEIDSKRPELFLREKVEDFFDSYEPFPFNTFFQYLKSFFPQNDCDPKQQAIDAAVALIKRDVISVYPVQRYDESLLFLLQRESIRSFLANQLESLAKNFITCEDSKLEDFIAKYHDSPCVQLFNTIDDRRKSEYWLHLRDNLLAKKRLDEILNKNKQIFVSLSQILNRVLDLNNSLRQNYEDDYFKEIFRLFFGDFLTRLLKPSKRMLKFFLKFSKLFSIISLPNVDDYLNDAELLLRYKKLIKQSQNELKFFNVGENIKLACLQTPKQASLLLYSALNNYKLSLSFDRRILQSYAESLRDDRKDLFYLPEPVLEGFNSQEVANVLPQLIDKLQPVYCKEYSTISQLSFIQTIITLLNKSSCKQLKAQFIEKIKSYYIDSDFFFEGFSASFALSASFLVLLGLQIDEEEKIYDLIQVLFDSIPQHIINNHLSYIVTSLYKKCPNHVRIVFLGYLEDRFQLPVHQKSLAFELAKLCPLAFGRLGSKCRLLQVESSRNRFFFEASSEVQTLYLENYLTSEDDLQKLLKKIKEEKKKVADSSIIFCIKKKLSFQKKQNLPFFTEDSAEYWFNLAQHCLTCHQIRPLLFLLEAYDTHQHPSSDHSFLIYVVQQIICMNSQEANHSVVKALSKLEFYQRLKIFKTILDKKAHHILEFIIDRQAIFHELFPQEMFKTDDDYSQVHQSLIKFCIERKKFSCLKSSVFEETTATNPLDLSQYELFEVVKNNDADLVKKILSFLFRNRFFSGVFNYNNFIKLIGSSCVHPDVFECCFSSLFDHTADLPYYAVKTAEHIINDTNTEPTHQQKRLQKIKCILRSLLNRSRKTEVKKIIKSIIDTSCFSLKDLLLDHDFLSLDFSPREVEDLIISVQNSNHNDNLEYLLAHGIELTEKLEAYIDKPGLLLVVDAFRKLPPPTLTHLIRLQNQNVDPDKNKIDNTEEVKKASSEILRERLNKRSNPLTNNELHDIINEAIFVLEKKDKPKIDIEDVQLSLTDQLKLLELLDKKFDDLSYLEKRYKEQVSISSNLLRLNSKKNHYNLFQLLFAIYKVYGFFRGIRLVWRNFTLDSIYNVGFFFPKSSQGLIEAINKKMLQLKGESSIIISDGIKKNQILFHLIQKQNSYRIDRLCLSSTDSKEPCFSPSLSI